MSEISHIILPDESELYFKDAQAREDIAALEALDPIPSPASPTTGDVLTWDGDSWEAAPPQGGGGDVTDVKVNGTSVVDANGVAKIPMANGSTPGVVTFGTSNPSIARASSGYPYVVKATDAEVKAGSNSYKPIVPGNQDAAVFYGLAEAAGSSMSGSGNAVGTYTEAAKAAIREMLGVTEVVEAVEDQLVWKLDWEHAVTVAEEQTVSFESAGTGLYKYAGTLTGWNWSAENANLLTNVYIIHFDGEEYICPLWRSFASNPDGNQNITQFGMGNAALISAHNPFSSDAPVFFCLRYDGSTQVSEIYTDQEGATHTVSIDRVPVIFGPIHESFEPLLTRGTGTYSIMSVDAESAGNMSVALGLGAKTASSSVAVGRMAVASNGSSMALGYNVVASGSSAVALGTLARAKAAYAVAIGVQTEATKEAATAIGRGVLANSTKQTVLGWFNVADSAGTYAFILGDGSSTNARKNLFTISHDGTVVSNGKTLATVDQIPDDAADVGAIPAPANPSSGDILKFDGDNWEPAADDAYRLPAGGIPASDLVSGVQTSLGKADTAYQKPSGGVPSSDLASGVQTSLGKADTAYQKPSGGVPASDLASGVQTSLGKADTAYQKPAGGVPASDLASGVQTSLGKADTAYQKPSGGVPASDLASGVQTSLGKADTAYQKPFGGVPVTDLASGVQTSLGKADSAYQLPSGGMPSTDMASAVQTSLGKADTAYQKPSGGVPESDLAQSVQDSLDLADSAYQKPAAGVPATDLEGTYAGAATAGGTADRAAAIPFGIVDSTSTATAFTATVPGITELADGVCCFLMNGVVTSASGFTVNINGLGAKPVYSTLAAASRATTLFNSAYTLLLVYNSHRVSGGCWDAYYGYDSNTNTIGYQIRTQVQTLPMTNIVYRYRLLFTSADGEHYVPANSSSSTNATAARTVCQTPIDPFGPIVYYGTTASVAVGSRPGATYLWQQYNSISLGYSFNKTGAALTLTSWKPIYIKCAPQDDGSAIIDADTPYVQDLPSTADGKIYIFIGIANAATTLDFMFTHPVYWHDGTGIRIWTGAAPSAGTITDVTVNGTSVVSDGVAAVSVPTSAADVSAVPTTRTVNGKSLSNDITLSASDVSALPSSTTIPSTAADVGAIAAPSSPSSGQVLTYNGSAWVAATPSGGSGLPAVTTSDNGKFLRVVNGAWAADTVSSANGVSF